MATIQSSDLPGHLAQRLVRRDEPRDGGFVLVWLRVAVRGHENPALDVGILQAIALDRPLLVYHAVSERYPHASDRHHAFILEGARDLAAELKSRGISCVFHVERPGHRGPVLRELAGDACLVVTDAMPLDPLRSWTRRLAKSVPVWEVDASCIVPMHLLPRSPDRAFRFRKATQSMRQAFEWGWPEVDGQPWSFEGTLPFEPVDIEQADLAELIGACAIDHQVAPVTDTRGGSVAGYARWSAFRDSGLSRYARDRNDAARPGGVSRMSPYLHYGHVSPFRIAREASAFRADKFLDELLIWREMAWHTCHHLQAPRDWQTLPAWARETLQDHADDPRHHLPLESLEEGQTGDELWDLAQQSLVRHGELHNNLRMTWGKAVLQWTRSPRQALARLYDLNDRFALDGRDPSSVGGINWCLGAQDRPFTPEQPIYGGVRSRSVKTHARRLDLDRYGAHVGRPAAGRAERVLVIGAGIAGAAAARSLHRMGVDVLVVDKARGPGGRMSSRRSEFGRFDHGAQSFTARDPRFLRQVRTWQAAGQVAPWQGRLGLHDGSMVDDTLRSERWVATPRMSALPRHVLGGVPAEFGCRVDELVRGDRGIRARAGERDLGEFGRVIVTAPAPQAVELLHGVSSDLADAMGQVQVAPCWALMLTGLARMPYDAVRLARGPIAWMARQDTLPGRETGHARWVVHARDDWSVAHLEGSPETITELLLEALAELRLGEVTAVSAHRWRYSRVTRALGVDLLEDRGVLVAGDGCLGGRVEDAWLSGVAAAGHLLRAWTLGAKDPEIADSATGLTA